jgi:hypothetical protein
VPRKKVRVVAASFVSEISRAMFSAFTSLLSSSRAFRALAFASELDHKPAPFAKPCVRVLNPGWRGPLCGFVFR